MIEDANELLAILDAEGDGGAAWWTTKDGAEPITSEQKAYKISLGYPASYSASHYNVPLYTHPAQSIEAALRYRDEQEKGE